MLTKIVDQKGRVNLGERFANRTVIIEEVDATEVRVTLARIVPEREAWLHENGDAKASVMRGLKQAKEGELSDGPDLKAGMKLANEIEADEYVQGKVDRRSNGSIQSTAGGGGARKGRAAGRGKRKVL